MYPVAQDVAEQPYSIEIPMGPTAQRLDEETSI